MFKKSNQVTLRVHAADSTATYELDLLSGSISLKSTVFYAYGIVFFLNHKTTKMQFFPHQYICNLLPRIHLNKKTFKRNIFLN